MPRFVPARIDEPDAARLLEDYFTSRELGFVGGVYRRTSPDPAAFAPPDGVFLLVYDDAGAPVGCGGVRMLSPDRAEVKHLWLDPSTRRRGWGRTLLTELEARAAELGANEVVLDTNATLEAAQSLYRSSGYEQIEPYNDNPNATHWFRKAL
ncbi:MAG: GNAT family N-acetyltransferase [Microbacteriaceae bacterium]|nr:GNAT family N-acetyltransferase [Microbacteriaceae bacterium]